MVSAYVGAKNAFKGGKFCPCIHGVEEMVEFVKISKNGTLLKIKEVSDKFRYRPYRWNLEE